ncbi:MAG: creatininase family protein [Carboxylicivirga sp.]|jgi:creatinine amidohydrolase|nr:creatininase family protein [Carboxylicivirga sp.]
MNEQIINEPWLLSYTNWGMVQKEQYEIAILPWGATEPHNLHLPYGTDSLQASELASGAARLAWKKGVRCGVLPAIPLGVQNPGQIDVPFCIHTRASTQLAILTDILASLEHQKINKLIILNSHGGNDFKSIIRELQPKFATMFIGVMDWFRIKECYQFFDDPGDHAGEMETALMQYLYPRLIDLDSAGDGNSQPFKPQCMKSGMIWTPRNWSKVSADTGIGNPKAASAEKGKQCYQYLTERLAAGLEELAGLEPNDIYDE